MYNKIQMLLKTMCNHKPYFVCQKKRKRKKSIINVITLSNIKFGEKL